MDHATFEKSSYHKLILILKCGGLTAVKLSFEKIFLKTKEVFRKVTNQNPNFSKINIGEIINYLIEITELAISIQLRIRLVYKVLIKIDVKIC